MSKKLFGQIVLLIVIANLMYLGVLQVVNWQSRRQYDAALEEARTRSEASIRDAQAASERADDLERQALTGLSEVSPSAAADNKAIAASPTYSDADGFAEPDASSEGEP